MLRPGKQVIQLKRLVETCWTCRHTSIVAVRQTFGAKQTDPSGNRYSRETLDCTGTARFGPPEGF